MKNLAIFYRDRDNQRAINYIEDNFYKILGDYVNITIRSNCGIQENSQF